MSQLQSRIDRLERLVTELMRKLAQAEARAGRAEQTVGVIRNAGGS